MLPGAMIGIGVGWALAACVTVDGVRLMVGAVAIVFVQRWLYLLDPPGCGHATRAQPDARAAFWGTVAASPASSPMSAARLPDLRAVAPARPEGVHRHRRHLLRRHNVVKLVPYFALGQFDSTNLMASLVLMPLAPLATLAGAWMVRRMRPRVFYPVTYLTVGSSRCKLVGDGIAQLFYAHESLAGFRDRRNAVVPHCSKRGHRAGVFRALPSRFTPDENRRAHPA